MAQAASDSRKKREGREGINRDACGQTTDVIATHTTRACFRSTEKERERDGTIF